MLLFFFSGNKKRMNRRSIKPLQLQKVPLKHPLCLLKGLPSFLKASVLCLSSGNARYNLIVQVRSPTVLVVLCGCEMKLGFES